MLFLLVSLAALPAPPLASPDAAAQVAHVARHLSRDEFVSVVGCAFRGARASPNATLQATVSRCAASDDRRRMDAHASAVVDALTTAVAALMLTCQDSFAGEGALSYCSLAPPKEEAARFIVGTGLATSLLYFAEPFVAQSAESAPLSPEYVQRRLYVGAAALVKSLLVAYSVEGGRSTPPRAGA